MFVSLSLSLHNRTEAMGHRITTMKGVEIRHRRSACCQQVGHIQIRTAVVAAANSAAAEDDDADEKSAPK